MTLEPEAVQRITKFAVANNIDFRWGFCAATKHNYPGPRSADPNPYVVYWVDGDRGCRTVREFLTLKDAREVARQLNTALSQFHI